MGRECQLTFLCFLAYRLPGADGIAFVAAHRDGTVLLYHKVGWLIGLNHAQELCPRRARNLRSQRLLAASLCLPALPTTCLLPLTCRWWAAAASQSSWRAAAASTRCGRQPRSCKGLAAEVGRAYLSRCRSMHNLPCHTAYLGRGRDLHAAHIAHPLNYHSSSACRRRQCGGGVA